MDYVERFKYDGYCVIPNVISESESRKYIDIVKSVIQNNILVKDYKGDTNRLNNLSQIEPQFKSLYSNPKIVEVVKDILDIESVDVWRDRLYPCEKIMHPPLQNYSIVKSSPNKTLTCYLCLIDATGMSVQHESHLISKPFEHNHMNSVDGEGTIHSVNCNLTELKGNLSAVLVHTNTIVEGKNPIDLGGTFSPKVVWEYIDTNQKNVYSKDNIEHGRFTL